MLYSCAPPSTARIASCTWASCVSNVSKWFHLLSALKPILSGANPIVFILARFLLRLIFLLH